MSCHNAASSVANGDTRSFGKKKRNIISSSNMAEWKLTVKSSHDLNLNLDPWIVGL